MTPVVTAAEMRELDRTTIEEIGLPAMTLMETAGRAVADAALRMLGGSRGHVMVVCGPGNNGGDGFVAARVLRDRGVDAVVYLAVAFEAVRGDARVHLEIFERAGGLVRLIAAPDQLAGLGGSGAALVPLLVPSLVPVLVIDALFGVGLARPIEGHLADVVAMMGKAGRILAVDIPSGIDADTGCDLGAAVTAERTVTMAALKIALVSAPGFARAGEVEVAEIGIPRALIAKSGIRASLVEPGDVARWLPRPRVLDHKGRRGHVLVVGGSPGMRGAGRLAAAAALRAGAGLCTLAGDGELDAPDSVMTRSLVPGGELAAVLAGKAAVVIGPGIGASLASAARVREVLASGLPTVLDADALNVLATDPAAIDPTGGPRPAGTAVGVPTPRDLASPIDPTGGGPRPAGTAVGVPTPRDLPSPIAGAAGPVVLTPHPGEASRLLAITTGEVEADRLGAARALAAKTRAVVVLKGARTIVCDGASGDLHCSINPTGGPALATGGSGDVLAGTIGALMAQGLSAVDAARAGVFVHGAAGDQLAKLHGARGVVSSDLPDAIASAIHTLSLAR